MNLKLLSLLTDHSVEQAPVRLFNMNSLRLWDKSPPDHTFVVKRLFLSFTNC